MTPKIERILVKYITKSATAADLDALSEWIKTPSNITVFKNYIQTHYVVTYSMNNPDSKRVADQLLKSIRKEKSLVYRLKNQSLYKYTAAAVLIGVLVTSYFLKDTMLNNENETAPIIVNSIETGTDKATLTLEDGSQVALEKGNSYQTQNVKSNGEKLVYEAGSGKEIAYNYLTIPRGGQFFVKLADGTQVWLNSETQLKYPKNFIKGQTREVELVYGEAYFDVSPSSNHNGAKFKVINAAQNIEVLGTEFNIKAYKDETIVFTTLVEGKVAINSEGANKMLKPSEQSILNTKTSKIDIKVVEVYNQISWKEGIFTFEKMPLKDIAKVLSRWYDVDFVFENKDSREKRFNGSLKRNIKINEILDVIKNFEKIKDYSMHGNTIVIK